MGQPFEYRPEDGAVSQMMQQMAPVQVAVQETYHAAKTWSQSVVDWFITHVGYDMVAIMLIGGIPFLIYYRKNIFGMFKKGK